MLAARHFLFGPAAFHISALSISLIIVSLPSEELFDVVDRFDRVSETRTRSEVHQLQLRHRAAHILLIRSDGRMLIHLRTENKEEFPSVWTSSASGHVSAGETYQESATRELHEELAIRASLNRIGRIAACPDTSNEFTEVFVACSDDTPSPDPNEIADTQWLTPDEICTEISAEPDKFSPAFRLIMATFLPDLMNIVHERS